MVFFFFKFKHFKKQFKYTLVELVDGEEMKGNGFLKKKKIKHFKRQPKYTLVELGDGEEMEGSRR